MDHLWFYWIVAAILLVLAKLLLTGLVFLCLSFGALGAAAASALGMALHIQIVAFTLSTTTFFVAVRPFMLRHLGRPRGSTNTNVDALIGRNALVIEALDPIQQTGTVKVRGETWSALADGTDPISIGTQVSVVAVSGNKLVVRRTR